jgi:hypothetical protein
VSNWVGEIVEWSDISSIKLEAYPKLSYNDDLALLQAEIDQAICILPVLHMMKIPLDPTRKAVALNMDDQEITMQYPQQSLFVKQYFHCFLAGSLVNDHFREAYTPLGLGIHTRAKALDSKCYALLMSHEASLFSFLSCFTRDPAYTPLLKTIGKNLLKDHQDPLMQTILIKNLSLLLKGQYFILKDLVSYILS